MSPDGRQPELLAVLFDMDGTLTDSEKLWALALDELAAALGGSISAAAAAAMVGLPMRPSVEILHAEVGVDRDWRVTAAELNALTAQHFRSGLPWKPGARELLTAVRAAGLLTALVTATERPLVQTALETLGCDNFDVIITGDDVTLGKPDPQPYARALAALGVATDAAIAIEDSPNGATSAVAAGLTVLIVPSEIEVPPGGRRVFVPSLVQVSVAHLHALPRQ